MTSDLMLSQNQTDSVFIRRKNEGNENITTELYE